MNIDDITIEIMQEEDWNNEFCGYWLNVIFFSETPHNGVCIPEYDDSLMLVGPGHCFKTIKHAKQFIKDFIGHVRIKIV